MVITSKVRSQFFENQQQLIRIAQDDARSSVPTKRSGTPWTHDEHERFLRALEKYPSGPWKLIAWSVGTRTTRQTMTHAQKYREKIARRRRLDEQAEALSRCSSFQTVADSGADSYKSERAVAAESVSVSASPSPSPSALQSTSSAPTLSVFALGSGAGVSSATVAATARGDGEYADAYVNFNGNDRDERVLDASIALLLESYEPLEIGADESFWEELRAFSDELFE